MNSYILTKSITPKTNNEDYVEVFENKILQLRGYILGDGIGSHYKPNEGSKFCVVRLKYYIENCIEKDELDLKLFFGKVAKDMILEFDSSYDIAVNIEKEKCYGTTLICVIEEVNKFTIAYVGNGSIWHFRGNFSKFSPHRYLPWNVINLLNPHTNEIDGKETLYKFIALETSTEQVIPSLIEIQKDNELYGDLLLASTDGLFSADHNAIAKDKEGNIWISGEKKIELFINSLKSYFNEEKKLDSETLEKYVDTYLNDIQTKNLVDDDLSFGLIVTSPVLKK